MGKFQFESKLDPGNANANFEQALMRYRSKKRKKRNKVKKEKESIENRKKEATSASQEGDHVMIVFLSFSPFPTFYYFFKLNREKNKQGGERLFSVHNFFFLFLYFLSILVTESVDVLR